jgi:hypothetical protein
MDCEEDMENVVNPFYRSRSAPVVVVPADEMDCDEDMESAGNPFLHPRSSTVVVPAAEMDCDEDMESVVNGDHGTEVVLVAGPEMDCDEDMLEEPPVLSTSTAVEDKMLVDLPETFASAYDDMEVGKVSEYEDNIEEVMAALYEGIQADGDVPPAKPVVVEFEAFELEPAAAPEEAILAAKEVQAPAVSCAEPEEKEIEYKADLSDDADFKADLEDLIASFQAWKLSPPAPKEEPEPPSASVQGPAAESAEPKETALVAVPAVAVSCGPPPSDDANEGSSDSFSSLLAALPPRIRRPHKWGKARVARIQPRPVLFRTSDPPPLAFALKPQDLFPSGSGTVSSNVPSPPAEHEHREPRVPGPAFESPQPALPSRAVTPVAPPLPPQSSVVTVDVELPAPHRAVPHVFSRALRVLFGFIVAFGIFCGIPAKQAAVPTTGHAFRSAYGTNATVYPVDERQIKPCGEQTTQHESRARASFEYKESAKFGS